MISLERALKDDRLMRAATGMNAKAFEALIEPFKIHWIKYRKKEMNIISTRGRIGTLETIRHKLFFILVYYKAYPTFDVCSLMFGADRSRCCRWVHCFSKVLQKALGHELSLPARRASTLQDVFTAMPDIKELYVDGTERPVRRPKDSLRQKKYYSGKKKRHCIKNILIADSNKKIVGLSKTKTGSIHDYKLFKDFNVADQLEDYDLYLDTGFQGIRTDFNKLKIHMPKKKPKNKDLSLLDKENNKIISQKRIKIEHTISGPKRLGILSNIFRNYKYNFNDVAMLNGCGLWNFYLKHS